MQLVYIAPLSWSSFSQRPHKFVEWFHDKTGGNVLWVNPYPTRFPKPHDIFRIINKPKLDVEFVNPDWLRVLSISCLPIEPIPFSGIFNSFFWSEAISLIDEFSKSERTIFCVGKPSAFSVLILNRFKDSFFIYDAMDDFPDFYTGFSKLALASREKKIAIGCSLVLTSSTKLKEKWLCYQSSVLLIKNALDLTKLENIWKYYSDSSVKVFGYVGTIADWFDWDLVFKISELRPNDKIVLIGPCFKKSPMPLNPNIFLLPAVSHDEALEHMSTFDVGIIPFKICRLTSSVDPIKYYEYRGIGLPVLTTDFGEMSFRKREKGVFVIDSLLDLDKQINNALLHRDSFDDIKLFKFENSWESRFDSMSIF